MQVQDEKRTPPNILWISVEDSSPRFGCYGDSLARTPHIDGLAAQGVRYPNAFATAGACAPSRSAIITGMYATSIGTHHMRASHTEPHAPELPTPYDAVPPHYVKMFSEYLRAEGYYCTNNVKTDYQFASPYADGSPVTGWDECSTKAHWRNREPGQPFFAVFNTVVTHESGLWTGDRTPVTDPEQVEVPPYLPDTPKVRAAIARQYDNIAIADEYVGRILGELAEDGLADETIAFLWSDHGEGFPRAKHTLYDGGIRVPLIVRWPGRQQPGTVSDQLVSLVDLAPTVLSLAGIDVPRHLQGRPFIGPLAERREYVFAARDRGGAQYDMVRAVRDKRYKYMCNYAAHRPSLPWGGYIRPHPMFQEIEKLYLEDKLTDPVFAWTTMKRPAEELYDCVNDPYEMHNLACDPDFRPVLFRLRAQLDQWRAAYGDMGDISESEMVARMWPGGVQPQTASPLFVPLLGNGKQVEPVGNGGSAAYAEPVRIRLYCATQGASIAYTTEAGERPHWRLYVEPIRLHPGETTLRAKAIRLGYKESEEQSAVFVVTSGKAVHSPSADEDEDEDEAVGNHGK